jgi:phosphomannomutase
MIDRIAEKYDLPLYETPVGFNHIADHMLNEDVLIGGEESGGISFIGNIPEGDGVLMGLLLVEIVASSGRSLSDLIEDLFQEFGPVFYKRHDLRLKHPVEKSVMVSNLVNDPPEKIGGEIVSNLKTIDGVKYIMSDDSWLLIRPSGTEPVLRVYAEGRTEKMLEALLGFGEKIAETVT